MTALTSESIAVLSGPVILLAGILPQYNTLVVLAGTTLLGTAAGLVGTFMLLRRQALLGDVVSHAALPGVAAAFLVGELIAPGSGRSLPWLLAGAGTAGLLAVVTVTLLQRWSGTRPDAVLAIVLGVFFGMGAVLLKAVQAVPSGNQAGLNHFIMGAAATIVYRDVLLIAAAAVVVLLLCAAFFKELSVLCFDDDFAATQGWPVLLLDLGLTTLVVTVSVIGLQSVGILMVALLITPAASARFWTSSLTRMTVLSAVFGALGAASGCMASATIPRLAGGPTIVLAGSMVFVISLLFGTERGVVHRWWQSRQRRLQIGRDDLLRAMYEVIELRLAAAADDPEAPISADENLTKHVVQTRELLDRRTWPQRRVAQLIHRAERGGLVRMDSEQGWRFTQGGATAARNAVRHHRLWELFLIQEASIDPSHVDRDADFIEHILEPEIVEQLEALLTQRTAPLAVPRSPHPVDEPPPGPA